MSRVVRLAILTGQISSFWGSGIPVNKQKADTYVKNVPTFRVSPAVFNILHLATLNMSILFNILL